MFNNGNPQKIGADLSAIDISRGRDFGIPPYYQFVEFCIPNTKIGNWNDLISIGLMRNRVSSKHKDLEKNFNKLFI